MTKWDETYIMAVIGMPIYVVLIFFPHFARAEKIISVNDPKQVNVEPRKFAAEFADSDSPDAAFVRRCAGAHQNGWENFILFIGAVVAAAAGGVKPNFVNACCLIVLIARTLYLISYLAVEGGPLAYTRTLMWAVAVGASVAMAVKGCIEISD
eukprot:TRINITY_DN3976_c8_g1_i1.p1 TRINITY_DN3976_c8_g1~~TRINITY_DN3976_c8_g1_i1.p1  ORF type:complete len:153 (+),score=24.65 TRINITY_DN3976_c8_g1_i1:93-551(+)